MQNKIIKITDTTLRDGQQSLIATRMPINDMIPILDKMESVGFYSMDVWGGATFDSCLRFLNEDPWERLRTLKKHLKSTKLQMLLRGQNLLGYRSYADDVVETFVRKSIENGIDILRIFDALNDLRNVETSVKATKKENAHAQVCIAFTLSDVHTNEYYTKLAKDIESTGADSICIKDMAGLLLPFRASELVSSIKSVTNLPLQLHSHYTSGLASMTYIKAIEAGIDIIDTAMSPFALATSQPATDVMVTVLKDTEYDTKINSALLPDISEYFRGLREKALADGLLDPKVLSVDIDTLTYQVPGGMISNLVSQLKKANAMDKFEEVLKEIPKVRNDLGFIPLVTPTSQIVGTQAVMNVLSGERYKMIPKETKGIVKGLYGRTPVQISDEIKKKIIGDEEVITCRPADLLQPELESARSEITEFIEQEEDVLSYALFQQVAINYFKYREAEKYRINRDLYDKQNKTYPL